MKRKILLPIWIAVLIFLDQAVKFYIVQNFSLGQVRSFIPKVLSLTYLQNKGAAFSILENQQTFFIFVTVLVIGAATWYLIKNISGSRWLLAALTLIIAGGLGNFIDRLLQGYVVDMFQLDFINFGVFNVADSYLTVGVGLVLLLMLKEEFYGNKD